MSERGNKCEGSCEEHRGEVVRVEVVATWWKPQEFNYCQAAIEEDERRGFTVTILELGHDNPEMSE